MTTITTTEIGKRLGFTITADFITNKLKMTAGEFVKGKPRWTEKEFRTMCARLVNHCGEVGDADHTAPPDDDDEL